MDPLNVSRFAGFHGNSAGKVSACNAGYLGLIPGLGRSPAKLGTATHSRSILAQRIPWTILSQKVRQD